MSRRSSGFMHGDVVSGKLLRRRDCSIGLKVEDLEAVTLVRRYRCAESVCARIYSSIFNGPGMELPFGFRLICRNLTWIRVCEEQGLELLGGQRLAEQIALHLFAVVAS